ncbi:MAG: AarF/UbiB family protein [Chloroflexota bacterium]|nr:AarF/UbiB family protein [Chloroflexota bacterium]
MNWKRLAQILALLWREYRALAYFRTLSAAQKAQRTDIPARLVQALIDLGPTFVKLGQILSTRPDVLPQEYIAALERLQENVPPFAWAQVNALVRHELGRDLQAVFASFDRQPVAAASLSQVHFAVLHSGESVAVKVQRPGIRPLVKRDMAVLSRLIGFVTWLLPRQARRANLLAGFNEFKRYTLQELDFAQEGKTMERFRRNFQGWDDVVLPTVYWDYTTPRLLTMERVSGMRLRDAARLLPPAKREQLNTRLIEMEMKMFISDGLFHADLHPGNIFFREDGKIVLLDFGMYGELTDAQQDQFVLYWMAVVQNEVKRAFYHFQRQCERLADANEAAFFARFAELADRFYHSVLRETSIAQVYLEMIAAGYQYGFVFPSQLLLHAKAITTAEALTFALVPDLKFEQVSKPVIVREFARRVADPARLKYRMQQILPELLISGEVLPITARDPYRADPSAAFLWDELGAALLGALHTAERDAGLLKALINPSARQVLKNYHSAAEISVLLDRVWTEYNRLEPEIPLLDQLGPSMNLHLAGLTLAMDRVLLQAGHSAPAAHQIINDIAWRIYSKMGEGPLILASAFTNDPAKKMRLATQIFRSFPFSAPGYIWQDLPSDAQTVAFDCQKCPVAEFFQSKGEAELCVNTWCNLDFVLASKWGGTLKRTTTIAGGSKVCDFRWHIPTADQEPPIP